MLASKWESAGSSCASISTSSTSSSGCASRWAWATSSGRIGHDAPRRLIRKDAMLTLFNTLTGRQEVFRPIEPNRVRMYVCGVTVYDYCHIGHARSALIFDVLRRYLEYSGYQVTFVKNFTDVDDKIIKRANEQGVSWETITEKYIHAYHQDMEKLGVKPASKEPKATEHIQDIIGITQTLIKKGFAYLIDGDVYFQVEKYAD